MEPPWGPQSALPWGEPRSDWMLAPVLARASVRPWERASLHSSGRALVREAAAGEAAAAAGEAEEVAGRESSSPTRSGTWVHSQ